MNFKDKKRETLFRYWPLACMFIISMLASLSIAINPILSQVKWMEGFMGFVFCQFAMLKLFNLKEFVQVFCMYDLIASKMKIYGYIYPFIELILGMGYLSGYSPKRVYLVTIVIMAVSALGVIRALNKKLDTRCACMGTILNVPLSTVTLSEDIVMGLMSLSLLLY